MLSSAAEILSALGLEEVNPGAYAGRWLKPSGKPLAVENPATGITIASVAQASADDHEKVKIMGNFKNYIGKTLTIGGRMYQVGSFQDNEGAIEVISLTQDKTTIYFRPSGTGPNIRIYVFGPQATAQEELTKVTNDINTKFR